MKTVSKVRRFDGESEASFSSSHVFRDVCFLLFGFGLFYVRYICRYIYIYIYMYVYLYVICNSEGKASLLPNLPAVANECLLVRTASFKGTL